MKKRLISIVLTVLLLGTLFVPAASAKERFTDISGHWAEECVLRLAEAKIVHGYPDGSVKPDREITRGEFASLLVHAAGFDTEADGSWPQKYFDALSDHGALEDGKDCSGDDFITRMELITWTIRAMECKKYSIKEEEILKFPDTGDLSETEIGYLTEASASGLLTGYPDGTVRPGANCTRAEAFLIISRYEKAKEFLEEASHPGISAGTGLPQMSVSLEGPETAEAYSPIEIKVHHKNVEKLEWTITGGEDKPQRSNSIWESDLNEDGGTVTFFEAGRYYLHAKAYSDAGQKGEYLLGIEVKEPAIRLEAPEEIPVYYDTHIEAHPRSDVTDLVWTITRDSEPAQAEVYFGTLENTGGTLSFQQDGIYKLTLSGKDGLGKPVSASCSIFAYQKVSGEIIISRTACVGEDVFISTGDMRFPENAAVDWQILEEDKLLDWDSICEKGPENQWGGTVRFQKSGTYTIRLRVTDRFDRETVFEAAIRVYDSPAIELEAPKDSEMSHAVEIKAIVRNDITDLFWNVTRDGNPVQKEEYTGALDRTGGTLSFSRDGVYEFTLNGKDELGNAVSRSCETTVYQVVSGDLNIPSAVFSGEDVSISAENLIFDETMKTEWQVFQGETQLDWEEVFDRRLESEAGGTVRFLKTGEYLIRLKVTDRFGYETNLDASTTAYAPLAYSIEIPETAYVGNQVTVTTDGLDDSFSSVEWKINDKAIADCDSVQQEDASLDYSGGTLCFSEPGEYQISLTVPHESGKSVTRYAGIRIYPVVGVSLSAPEWAAVGEEIDIQGVYSNNSDNLAPQWTIEKDGKPISESNCLKGSFASGNVLFTKKGEYEVTTSVTDALNRTFSASRSITVEQLPLPEPEFTIPTGSYTDRYFDVSFSEDMSKYHVQWTYSKDGITGAETKYINGRLGNNGGSIQCTEAGQYELTVTVSDGYGQEKKYSSSLTIKTAPTFVCYISNYLRVGDGCGAVYKVTNSPGGGIIWNLYRNGIKVSMRDYADFKNDSVQINISFKEAGTYCLEAVLYGSYGSKFTFPYYITVSPR